MRQKAPGVSFWLAPAKSPVALGIVDAGQVGQWVTTKTIPIPVTTDMGRQAATAAVPDDLTHVRLEFDLVATAGGQSATVLSFRQLFVVLQVSGLPGAGPNLMPTQFAFEDTVLTPSAKGPVRAKGVSPNGWRVTAGLHPLLRPGVAGQFSINAEFVDATELWWKVHPDTTWGWYWHPDAKGRQEHLRVLAWTGGGNPMIWFAALPDAAVASTPGGGAAATPPTPADIVFVRPPPNINSFPYAPTQAGFEAPMHGDRTLVNLARYLLAPVPEKTALAMKTAGVRSAELLADQVQPKATTPSITPADPMSLMKLTDAAGNVRTEAFTDGRANAFIPVGLETAVQRSGGAHLLLLPLGFDASEGDPKRGIPGNPQGGYEAVKLPGLRTTVRSAVSLLWSINALGRDKTTPPQAAERQLWVAGHSSGNRSSWEILANNGPDIDRVVSFDSDTLATGIDTLKAVGAKRPKDKPIHAFVIRTPAQGDPAGMSVAMDTALRDLRASNVLTTELPDFSTRGSYWHLNPPPITNPYLLYVLARWSVPSSPKPGAPTLLDLSARSPGNWGFLFFHEMAVFGGELVQPPAAAGAAPPPPYVRTFFEMALGAPNPRP